jgi:hypothetical protein
MIVLHQSDAQERAWHLLQIVALTKRLHAEYFFVT